MLIDMYCNDDAKLRMCEIHTQAPTHTHTLSHEATKALDDSIVCLQTHSNGTHTHTHTHHTTTTHTHTHNPPHTHKNSIHNGYYRHYKPQKPHSHTPTPLHTHTPN